MFAKERKRVFPGAQRMHRGRHEVGARLRACKASSVIDLLVVHGHRGTPVGLVISRLPFGPPAHFTLWNVRVSDILRYPFPVPKDDSHRVITFTNRDGYMSFRHHVYKKTDRLNVELPEVGPRFELKLCVILPGTLDQEATADVEWRWHPYTNTARKRIFLSTD
ncbi:U3 small nucleolar ribonucleoprotein IMP4 [Plecturocebus cupreus]